MSLMLLLLLLLLVLLCQTMVLPGPSASDPCVLELEELRRDVRTLQNKLLIGAWQLTHLKTHSYTITHPPPSTNQTEEHRTGALASLPPAGSLIVHDKDCSELFDRRRPGSGFYRIRPRVDQEPVLVYCDMEDGGGWTVIQRRRHGRVDFNRDWVDYRDGFGDFKLWNDEFWLGNEHIHSLVKDGENLVKIDLMDWSGEKTHVYYQNFRITEEKDSYRLRYGVYSGLGGEANRLRIAIVYGMVCIVVVEGMLYLEEGGWWSSGLPLSVGCSSAPETRTMTAIYRAAVPRRTEEGGGITGVMQPT
ncbi:fibrinogen like 1B isoform X4 [Coregonus clupeaformis]|uniref:fibrinogen like 1B isoform X4 n=1 Tax=Coregonus clupeaformis TaxID=59861 RepID=UPI001E1C98DD|nr:fibrinogen like 1B isoform X4 [Coregonus clupeaformis]